MAIAHPPELKELTPQGITVRYCRNRVRCMKGDLVLFHHWHEEYEIMSIESGHGIFHIDGETVEASEGDVLFIPPNCLHGGYNASDRPFEYFAIVFNSDLLSSIGYDLEFEQYIAPFLSGRLRFPFVQSASDPASARYRNIVKAAIHDFEKGKRARELIFKYQMQLLFAVMSSRYYPEQYKSRRFPATPLHHVEALKKLIQYIETNYAETITVESAAKMVNLSSFHFCKMFKRMTGRTLIDFVNLHRVNQATKMLRETDLSIAEIAERIGCCNANYFSKIYFRYKGISPSAARKTR